MDLPRLAIVPEERGKLIQAEEALIVVNNMEKAEQNENTLQPGDNVNGNNIPIEEEEQAANVPETPRE